MDLILDILRTGIDVLGFPATNASAVLGYPAIGDSAADGRRPLKLSNRLHAGFHGIQERRTLTQQIPPGGYQSDNTLLSHTTNLQEIIVSYFLQMLHSSRKAELGEVFKYS